MIKSTKSVNRLLRIVLLFGAPAFWIGCSSNTQLATHEAAISSNESEDVASTTRDESFEVRDPSNLDDGILVVLNSDAMRTHRLTKEDVIRAVKPSELVPSSGTSELPGVVYHKGLRDEKFPDILLFASPDGKEVVKLKDVARLRLLDGSEWTPR